MPARPRDPSDPDFPHGTALGYRAGCRARSGAPCPATPTCRQAIHAEEARKGPRFYSAYSLRNHVMGFINQGWRTLDVAAAANVGKATINAITFRRQSRVTADVARRIADVTVQDLLDGGTCEVPTHVCAWLVGSLMANGHTLQSLADLLGRHVGLLRRIVIQDKPRVSREVYEDLVVLHHRMADVTGTSREARTRAQALGYRTPDEYAPDGVLWDDKQVNPKREAMLAERDHGAWARLETLHMSLCQRLSAGVIADRLGSVSEDDVHRYREDAGLKFAAMTELSYAPGTGNHVQLVAGHDHAAEIMAVLQEWMADRTQDPYPLVRKLGLMTAPKWARLDNPHRPKLRSAA